MSDEAYAINWLNRFYQDCLMQHDFLRIGQRWILHAMRHLEDDLDDRIRGEQ